MYLCISDLTHPPGERPRSHDATRPKYRSDARDIEMADDHINQLISAAKAEATAAAAKESAARARAAKKIEAREAFERAERVNAAAHQLKGSHQKSRGHYDLSGAEADALALAEAAMASTWQAAAQEMAKAKQMVEAAQRELELEKEKRTTHAQNMALRRLSRQQLSRAWNAWQDAAYAKRRAQRLLQAAAQRLLRPAKAACFQHWRSDWEVAAREDAASQWESAAQGAIDQIYIDAMARVAAAEAAAREQAELARLAMLEAEAAKAEALQLRAAAQSTEAAVSEQKPRALFSRKSRSKA